MHSALLKRIGTYAMAPQQQQQLCLLRCEALRIVAKSIDQISHWFEGCPCHEDIRMSSKHYTTRQRRLQQSIGPSGMCPWAGRRGTEVVLGKVQDFLSIVSNASSNHFDHLLSHASHPHRSRVLAEFRLLTSSVCEELSSKLSFHRELPWELLGGFGSHLGREDEAKACLVQCCSSFDRLWADPSKRKSLHRVAVHVLSPTSTVIPLVDMYAASVRDLTSFPELFCELRVLSLSVLVERTIESVHASIKAESRASHGILPGLVWLLFSCVINTATSLC